MCKIKVKRIGLVWFVVSRLGNTMPLTEYYKDMTPPNHPVSILLLGAVFNSRSS